MNPNKAHGHDGASVRMLKLSCPSVIKTLLIIFPNCLKFGFFPDGWKNSNVVPAHKKGKKQIFYNYRPIYFLPPTCSKIFEKLVFDPFFELIENNFLSNTQSGVKPNDSCVNQIISITRSICSAFDAYPSLEVRRVFLDLSKAFDRV